MRATTYYFKTKCCVVTVTDHRENEKEEKEEEDVENEETNSVQRVSGANTQH